MDSHSLIMRAKKAYVDQSESSRPGIALAHSVEFCGIRPEMYIKDLL